MRYLVGLKKLPYLVPFIAVTSPFLVTRAFMSSSTTSTTCAGEGLSLNFDGIPLKPIKSESEPFGETIQSETLWQRENGGALIMVVRRPG